jgi:hypothetical protein
MLLLQCIGAFIASASLTLVLILCVRYFEKKKEKCQRREKRNNKEKE